MKRKRDKEFIQARKALMSDKERPFAERKQAADELMDDIMNPYEDFDPETFDPMEETQDYDVIRRPREKPPRRFPNQHRLKPKKIRDGQMAGMYETKQDLYLLIVELSERVSDLEDEVDGLKKQPSKRNAQ